MTHDLVCSRISQDLAKDLAMLAREIHDVAGEIDSVSPAAEPAPQVTTGRLLVLMVTVLLCCITVASSSTPEQTHRDLLDGTSCGGMWLRR